MTEEEFDLIEKYLTSKLSESELKAFNQRMSVEDEFRQQVEIYATLHKGVKQYGRQELQKKLFPRKNIPFMVRLDTKWKIAIPIAAFILMLIAYRVIFPLENSRLFDQYYARIDSIHFATNRGEPGINEIKLKAFAKFKAQEYDSALLLLDGQDREDSEVNFLRGLIYLETEKWPEAESSFKESNSASLEISYDAHWYLALIYLKQNRTDEAKKELQLLIKVSTFHRERASRILEKLE